MGKGKNPTIDELRFIYGLLAQGFSDQDVLDKYGELSNRDKLGVLPYRQDIRFVRQRRKEFEGAQGILEAKFKAKSIPSWVQKHWDDLGKTACQLDDMWTKHLESGRIIEDYIVDTESDWFESFNLRYGYQMAQLLSHLKAEFPREFEGIDSWWYLVRSPLPKGCLRMIMLVSKRKTFEGTCEICQGWQK
jgi:hypothetical protein